MVASEVDEFIGTINSSTSNSPTTHIYCKPVKIKDAHKSRDTESKQSDGQTKSMISDDKVPSNVVAIDISGQPFSRMASFRRSLIHVDFLIRRKKKKDKRRNTVAEGDVKELKDALQKIVNDESQLTIPNGINSYHQQFISEECHNSKVHENAHNDKSLPEQNNNADSINTPKKHNYINSTEIYATYDEKIKNALNNEELKKEHKLTDLESTSKVLSSGKRKPKSHIPISTVSAAMNVAVEMRQCNGLQKEKPRLNGVYNSSDTNSSDSDHKLQDDKRLSNSSFNEDGSQDESWANYKRRLQEKCKIVANRKTSNGKNISKDSEVSSSASSENIEPNDTTAATSTESDSFFMSSDESDEESSEVVYFQENYGSSTSVGTESGGSLNSILSETGTEMTSSTGTLTSIGREYLLTPPPPPPPMMISATVNDRDLVEKLSSDISGVDQTYSTRTLTGKKSTKSETISQKQSKKQTKSSKPPKSDPFISQKNGTENTKNLFTSLVGLKTHSKDRHKNKDLEKKKIKSPHQPVFDMYGNNSPTKTKQMPAFIKENISSVIQKQETSLMKSFLTNDRSKISQQLPDSKDVKSRTDSTLSRNTPSSICSNVSDNTNTKVSQTLHNVPSKYEPQVIVTPVQRYTNLEQKSTHYKGSLITQKQQGLNYKVNNPQPCNTNAESYKHIPLIKRPNPPVAMQHHDKSKVAARVMLDFDGKVLYATNSLDRKHYSFDHTVNTCSPVQNKSSDPHFKEKQLSNNGYYYCPQNSFQQNFQTSPTFNYNPNTAYPPGKEKVYSSQNASFNNSQVDYKSSNENHMKRDSHITKTVCEYQYSTPNTQRSHKCMPENLQAFVPKRTDIRPFSYAGPNSSDSYFNSPTDTLLPNPNISGLPIQENMLTRHNVNLHSKQMERLTLNTKGSLDRLSNTFSTPLTQPHNGSHLQKSPQSTMSTEDLFAVIHSCKKRMNIKTDSEVSLTSSSRSSSPSYLRTSSSRGTLAETGFLSPRSQIHLEMSGDRRSWADFRPVDSICHERKSLASDRLGPTKPTSMHDFKMLLLQARTNCQNSGQRKSAVEMLKLPLNQSPQSPASPPPFSLSPRNSISVSAQNSPTAEINIQNGHSTVPFKRGRARSLQARYVMYPPIFEDCSEDLDNCGDLVPNKSTAVVDSVCDKQNPDSQNYNRQIQKYSCDSEINSQQR